MKNLFKLTILLLLLSFVTSYGQMKQYHYKRPLKGISKDWHSIILPNPIFSKVSKDLADIRVFGITKNNDTIEAPYILKTSRDTFEKTKIDFKSINNAHNSQGYYYTFEIPSVKKINQLNLDFAVANFDWKLKLEGSQDLKEWFTITDDYRVVSIKNDVINYQFTKLVFPNSKYKYYRLLVKTKKNPKLKIAHLDFNIVKKGKFRTYSVRNISQSVVKKYKQTIVEITLDSLVPISYLKVNIASKIDYYRPFKLEYIHHRFKTEKGWKENYYTATTGILNSVDNNEIHFNTVIAKKLKLTIDNFDNKPLNISSIDCKGRIYTLTVRFDDDANYFLTYGYKKATKPNYDITRFLDKIPTNATSISLGDEISIEKATDTKTEALFTNKIWLWIIMFVIMFLLTWFSLKMIRNKQ